MTKVANIKEDARTLNTNSILQQLTGGKPFVNPFETKTVPPLLPSKDFSAIALRKIEESYLCEQCCSHKMVRMKSTLQGSVDVIAVYVGTTPTVVMPP
jgi:hypothetical protein